MTNRFRNALVTLAAVVLLASCGSANSPSDTAATPDSGANPNSNSGESVPGGSDETSGPDGTDGTNGEQDNSEQGMPGQQTPETDPVLAFKDEMLARLNEVRAQGGTCGGEVFGPAQPVQWDVNVESAAALHNAYMRAEEKVSHIGLGDSTPSERLTDSGFEWQTMAENIAAGYPTIAQVVEGWMNSNGHCRNIMNPLFDTIGADKVDGYETSDFINYWTLVLAAASPA